MSTLVTGGTGLVGSAVDADIKLSSKDGNLISLEDTLNIFSTWFPERVVHTAARVGGVGGNMSAKGAYY